MELYQYKEKPYDESDPESIERYAKKLMRNRLLSLLLIFMMVMTLLHITSKTILAFGGEDI